MRWIVFWCPNSLCFLRFCVQFLYSVDILNVVIFLFGRISGVWNIPLVGVCSMQSFTPLFLRPVDLCLNFFAGVLSFVLVHQVLAAFCTPSLLSPVLYSLSLSLERPLSNRRLLRPLEMFLSVWRGLGQRCDLLIAPLSGVHLHNNGVSLFLVLQDYPNLDFAYAAAFLIGCSWMAFAIGSFFVFYDMEMTKLLWKRSPHFIKDEDFLYYSPGASLVRWWRRLVECVHLCWCYSAWSMFLCVERWPSFFAPFS